nr:carboxyl transferase domain-containing protein [Actinomyces sp.]
MTRLLVAARATTAARVARSARRHGLSPVGVFTQAERDARWLGLLDDAVEVPSYDDVPAILAAAGQSGARLLHPGVGFAAESATLAHACLEAGLTWVGPSPQALELVTDKLALSRRATELSVPVPLTVGPVTCLEELIQAATQIAGPTVVKTVHGGGGRGVLPLPGSGAGQLRRAWQSLAGLGPLLLQADVTGARHIEVQALADGAGRVMTVGTRECSLQRRAQKIMEEAPAPFLAEGLVQELEDWTRLVLRSAGVRGVATCEFLLPRAGTPVLLEVNARLQVEHAVTEEASGMDLVRAQLVLAQGGDLAEVLATCGGSLLPSRRGPGPRVRLKGHAVEARLYAEDPDTLLPSQVPLRALSIPLSARTERAQVASRRPPGLPRLRVERATYPGDALQPAFSEPLALVSAAATCREEALDALDAALEKVEVQGPATLVPLLRQVLADPQMRDPAAYRVTTRWVEEHLRPHAAGAGWPENAPVLTEAVHAPAAPALELRSPMAGTLVMAAQPGPVSAGQSVAVIEAMKMRLPVPAPAAGTLEPAEPALEAGRAVRAGEVLARLVPEGSASQTTGEPATLLSPATKAGSAAARFRTAPAPRRRPSAAERVGKLVDPGSLRELVDQDAVLTAWARLEGREVAVWAQDPGVLGGTTGLAGARRVARLIDQAASRAVPVISLLDGGGARVQEGVDALAGVGLILASETRARGRTLQVGLVLGPAAGGAAYAPALTDLLIMVEGAGEVFLTGPAVLASSTGERTTPEDLGGARLHARRAGTAHLTVPDESAAWQAARHLVGMAPVSTGQGLALPLRTGGAGTQVTPGDRLTARTVPADLAEPYDVRLLLRRLTDRGELTELRKAWAPNVVTALARVEGVPVGIVATQPAVLAGSLDPLSSQKLTEHLELCSRLALPLLTVVDTPGFIPGTQAEEAGTVRLGARVVAAYAVYEAQGGPLLTLVTRRAYGGAYVALGSRALAGGRTGVWPGARIGVMDASSAVDLVHRRRLHQARQEGEDAEELRRSLIRHTLDSQSGETAVSRGWVDELVTPERTRSWIARCLDHAAYRPRQADHGPSGLGDGALPGTSQGNAPGGAGAVLRVTRLSGLHHRGDGWVECACGSRHWGLNGAAGLLVWRLAGPGPGEAGTASQAGSGGLEVLLELRAGWTHQGGTWGLPGGAVADGETAAEAALRECEEETSLPARVLCLGDVQVQEHGAWRYSTFAAQAPADPAWDRLVAVDGESARLEWVRLEPSGRSWREPGAGSLPLLPALSAVWPELAALLPAPGSQLLVGVG